ncbi:hypothetical protein MFIFM68171_00562 [Madurella fahalii]|uniref:Yeast cell wall synthesis Kre9/Knh1-like N-terminal domain-containing protein n=1 Tax=Madurella fahalii TaxID=1157608 RepID=A0ABQ0FXX4_9PEZI
MRPSQLYQVLATASLVPPCLAVNLTNEDYNIKLRSPFTITWTDAIGPVDITLIGDPNRRRSGTRSAHGTSYTWKPTSLPPFELYAIRIIDSTDEPIYSLSFQIRDVIVASSSVGNAEPIPTTVAVAPSSSTQSVPSLSTPPAAGENTGGSNSNTPPPAAESAGGLSTGAAAGIGAGAAVSAIALIAAIAYFFYRQGKAAGTRGGTTNTNSDHAGLAELGTSGENKQAIESDAGKHGKSPAELSGGPVVEVNAPADVTTISASYEAAHGGHWRAPHAAESYAAPPRD